MSKCRLKVRLKKKASGASRGIGYQELCGSHTPGLCLPGTLAVGESVYQEGSKFKLIAREDPVHGRGSRLLLNKTQETEALKTFVLNSSEEHTCLPSSSFRFCGEFLSPSGLLILCMPGEEFCILKFKVTQV